MVCYTTTAHLPVKGYPAQTRRLKIMRMFDYLVIRPGIKVRYCTGNVILHCDNNTTYLIEKKIIK